jgi:hypothetical protein
MQGDLEFNANNKIEVSQGLVNSLTAARNSSGDPLSAILLSLAIVEDNIALDPPDANYKQAEPPAPVLWSSTGNKSIDQVFSDYAKVISLDIAKLHAMERFEGATLAGDTAWAATQQSAYQSYATPADAARTVGIATDQQSEFRDWIQTIVGGEHRTTGMGMGRG